MVQSNLSVRYVFVAQSIFDRVTKIIRHPCERNFVLSQIAEINIRHEQEKAQTLRAHQIERDSSLKEQEQEKVR